MAVVFQIVGLVLTAAGLFVWFGPGPGLVGSGVLATVFGIAAERDRRGR